MLTKLTSKKKVVGVKQSRKAIRDGCAKYIYIACDADPLIVSPVAQSCTELGIPVDSHYTMAQLGLACKINVGASVVAVL